MYNLQPFSLRLFGHFFQALSVAYRMDQFCATVFSILVVFTTVASFIQCGKKSKKKALPPNYVPTPLSSTVMPTAMTNLSVVPAETKKGQPKSEPKEDDNNYENLTIGDLPPPPA
ncbi:hypothetical protein M3Y96_00953200 [Aphelenchoides besseyi]|nr:hypothetical protein M3Y96_00953200 [Aphelenchoides besseyi]